MLTQQELKEIVSYDPETGEMYWLIRSNGRVPAGSRVGSMSTTIGYMCFGYQKKNYLNHRAAFLLMTGAWPVDQLDHINGDRLDNRWCNLREATRRENMRNVGLQKNNTSGYKGVHQRENGKWRAVICVDLVQRNVGQFDTPEEAYKAYCDAADRLHGEFANHGIKERTA